MLQCFHSVRFLYYPHLLWMQQDEKTTLFQTLLAFVFSIVLSSKITTSIEYFTYIYCTYIHTLRHILPFFPTISSCSGPGGEVGSCRQHGVLKIEASVCEICRPWNTVGTFTYTLLHTTRLNFVFTNLFFFWLYVHHRSPLNVVHAGLDILRSELKNSFPTAAGPTILFLNDLVWTHTYMSIHLWKAHIYVIHEYTKKEFKKMCTINLQSVCIYRG